MNYSKDIQIKIKKSFKDIQRVYSILSTLKVPEIELERVVRCILYLSEDDYDLLDYWVSTANIDRRDVYYFAEYDNKSERKWDFNNPFDKQVEYEFRDK